MQQPLFIFSSTLNSTLSKSFTLFQSQLPIKLHSQLLLLLKNKINISTLTISIQNESLSKLPIQDHKYDVDLLTEQILLFDNDAEIYSFLETQKQLCSYNNQFIQLPFSLIKLSQRYLKREESFGSFLRLPENLDEYNSKQKLDELQTKCLQNLSEIKERRKKIDCCVICWEHYATHIIQPCMHLVICKDCTMVKKCPLCKGVVGQITGVFK